MFGFDAIRPETGEDGIPRIFVAISMMTPNTNVRVSRLDHDGRFRPVRGADPVRVSNTGTASFYDYEMPYGRPVRYAITAVNSFATAATIAPDRPYLLDPGNPRGAMRLEVANVAPETFETTTRATPTTLIEVLNRADPIPHTMGRRKSRSTELVLQTHTHAEIARLEALLSTGRTLLLNVPPALGWPMSWAYLHVGDVSMQRRGLLNDPSRIYTLPVREVARPAGSFVDEWAWNGVTEDISSWDELSVTFPTWDDLSTNTRLRAIP